MSEQESVKRLFERLDKQELLCFPAASKHAEVPTTHGVYVIRNPKDRVVYVGRTTRAKNGLHQRIRNHLAGKSAFVKEMLNGDGSKLRKRYTFQFLEVSNDRKRALLEYLATGIYCPKYLGLSLKKSGTKK